MLLRSDMPYRQLLSVLPTGSEAWIRAADWVEGINLLLLLLQTLSLPNTLTCSLYTSTLFKDGDACGLHVAALRESLPCCFAVSLFSAMDKLTS